MSKVRNMRVNHGLLNAAVVLEVVLICPSIFTAEETDNQISKSWYLDFKLTNCPSVPGTEGFPGAWDFHG